ncbi:hypothetical protein FKG94_15595 [Exilibacterium tricleocarpae]|uniref:Cyclic-phosphate processing Receiver domain-containing protein n=1 Tax=Exilibacterium tricleocarpae TaxID=2591008 RepID=A0A545TFS5_9GAMM|nr:cyclic-phosphate processing receiver domain-containing protein [Exilibacterium tricleocarpae]TQV76031.1 hypothetical protein FKG94_15595 [Exilibacterium tricleocarpae]
MELLIDATRTYSVDKVTRCVQQGKRALREMPVETLYLDHHFGERETGSDIIRWARERHLLPKQVVLVTASPRGRSDMAQLLRDAGYRSGDGIRYMKF